MSRGRETTALEAVAKHIAELDRRPAQQIELDEALRCLIDALGCAVAGSRSSVASVVNESSQSRGLLPEATAVGFGRMSIQDAVLLNSTSTRALDFNDTYSGRNNLHPSEIVIPIALAFAQRRDIPGSRLLEEIAKGYDVIIRLSEAIGPLLPNGWAPNATVGQIAAAGLAAWSLGLDEKRIAHAMAINVINSSTLAAVFKDGVSMAKSMASGLVVQRGIQAARLAACGATGPLRAIEGKSGFVEMVAKDFDLTALDREYQLPPITRTWLKAYPTMFHFHPSIEAALQLRRELAEGAAEIDTVEVRVTTPIAKVAAGPEHWNVRSHEDAQFSLPYSVAVSLVHGRCTIAEFTDEAITDRAVRELMSKISVEADDSLSAGGHPQPTIVRLALTDGSRREKKLRLPKGHADNRLSEDELRQKFRLLVEPVLGAHAAEELIGRLDRLGASEDLTPLFSALEGAEA